LNINVDVLLAGINILILFIYLLPVGDAYHSYNKKGRRMKRYPLAMIVASACLLPSISFAELNLMSYKHAYDNRPEIKKSNNSYLIDISKPDSNGTSIVYLNTDSYEKVISTVGINNSPSGNFANRKLKGVAAKKIILVVPYAYKLIISKEIRILGETADLSIVGANETVCENCSFINAAEVTIKTGESSEESDKNANGSFSLIGKLTTDSKKVAILLTRR
jgi:hypothetical protein